MKSSLFMIAAFTALVAAHPHQQHQHRRRHEKRDEIVWVTETDVVWETVEMTTTIWIDGDATTAPAATTSVYSNDAQFYQSDAQPAAESSSAYVAPAAISSPVYVAPAPSSTSIYVPPVTTSAYVAPAPVESAAADVAPAAASTSAYVAPAPVESAAADVAPAAASTSAYVAPTPIESTTSEASPVASSTSAYVAPTPIESTTSAAAAVASSTTPIDPSPVSPANPSVTTCTSDAPCTGDMTYYDASAGTGACGWNNDTMTEAVIALPHALMGTESNGNSYCGMTVTISYGGKSIEATVVDKCMGCVGDSIDLSNNAFDQLAEESLGRLSCKWHFN